MQQEFAREFGEVSPSVCSFGVDEPLDKDICANDHLVSANYTVKQ